MLLSQRQRHAGDVQDVQGDRGDRPGARRERRRHRGEPEAAPGHGRHRTGGPPHVQAGRGETRIHFLVLTMNLFIFCIRQCHRICFIKYKLAYELREYHY